MRRSVPRRRIQTATGAQSNAGDECAKGLIIHPPSNYERLARMQILWTTTGNARGATETLISIWTWTTVFRPATARHLSYSSASVHRVIVELRT
jgi:hypothetical protein